MSNDESAESVQRKQRVSGIFDRAATTFDHVGPRFFSHFGRRLVELAQISTGANVLDVATGRGAVLFPAAEAVGAQGQVTGIDLAESMVSETAKELARLGLAPNVKVRQMDAEQLQFPDGSFDFVLCSFAIFFFPQLDRGMAEFRRVLKPNGRIGVTTWSKLYDDQWVWFDEIAKTYLPTEGEPAESDAAAGPVFNTTEGLEAIMRAAGFVDVKIISETAEFVYASEEEFWSTLWSHGARGTLERIEQTAGADGLQRFKTEVFTKAQSIKQADGIHELFAVLFAVATRGGID